MIDLQKTSGLPIELTDDFHLKFDAPLNEVVPAVRKFSDMIPVLLDPGAKASREEMYYMYRDVHLPKDEDIIRKNNSRYDITILAPAMLGQEFNKTVGHYHPTIPGKNLAYPEMYEVLSGEALFLIQKLDDSGKNILDFQAIAAKIGDRVIYPPGYGHIIVNIGKEALVTANWVADHFVSLYQPIKDMHGMGYYAVTDGNGGYEFIPNKNYASVAPVKSSLAEHEDQPMYLSGIIDPRKLDFLNNPS